VISFEEFEPLWNYIIQLQQMFDSFGEDHDGRIDASELGRALAYYNLRVSPYIHDSEEVRDCAATESASWLWQHPGSPTNTNESGSLCLRMCCRAIYV